MQGIPAAPHDALCDGGAVAALVRARDAGEGRAQEYNDGAVPEQGGDLRGRRGGDEHGSHHEHRREDIASPQLRDPLIGYSTV